MNEQRPLTAYETWLQQRQSQQRPATPSGNDYMSTPRNWLPPSQRRTFTVPAGTSMYAVEDPFPDRINLDQRRASDADLARAAAQATQLSGSHTVSNPKADAQRGWHRVLRNDAATNRLHVDWARDDPE